MRDNDIQRRTTRVLSQAIQGRSGSYRQGKSFDYPVRFDGDSVIITIHKIFQKKELADKDYDVIVDLDVYNRLKDENRRLFVHPYIGGQWHRHDNVVRITVDMTEERPDNNWSLSWYVQVIGQKRASWQATSMEMT